MNLPTADDLLAAIAGNHTPDPILDAADAMHPVQQTRYMSFGIVMDTSKIWPIDKIQNAAAQLHASTDELAHLIHTIDTHIAEIPLRPILAATCADQTVGEYTAYLAYLMIEAWAEKLLNRDDGKRAAVHRACDAYDAFRAALLAGESHLPARPL